MVLVSIIETPSLPTVVNLVPLAHLVFILFRCERICFASDSTLINMFTFSIKNFLVILLPIFPIRAFFLIVYSASFFTIARGGNISQNAFASLWKTEFFFLSARKNVRQKHVRCILKTILYSCFPCSYDLSHKESSVPLFWVVLRLSSAH